MKIFLKAVAALFLLMLAIWAIRSDSGHDGYVSAAPLAEGGDGAWRRSPVWDDGRAEVCAYEVTWAHYGRRYDGRALLVLVKEPWAPDLDVKADSPRPDGFDVLKLNHVRDVPTGVYAYHQMASLYTRRDSGALQKLAAASSEACGVTTAEMVGGRLTTHSYFDGQGDRAASWPANALPEDGLPASLRDYVAGVAGRVPATLAVFPSLLSARLPELKPSTYQVERREVPAVDSPAGKVPGVEIRLTRGPSALAYTFDRQAPYRLLGFAREDGTAYRLAKCERIAYWQMNKPGDEAWLPRSAR
jgi:hypothetical protein